MGFFYIRKMKKTLIRNLKINRDYHVRNDINSALFRFKDDSNDRIGFELISLSNHGYIRGSNGLIYFSKRLTSFLYDPNSFRYGK
jgi:hypothetical protein